jgi:hypothetical protein
MQGEGHASEFPEEFLPLFTCGDLFMEKGMEKFLQAVLTVRRQLNSEVFTVDVPPEETFLSL